MHSYMCVRSRGALEYISVVLSSYSTIFFCRHADLAGHLPRSRRWNQDT